SLFFVQACAAQSQLPAEMPENITVYLNVSGGMMRAYKKITIDDGVLEFEELKGNRQNPQKWSAKISRQDLAKLYKTFVENKFDTIKNDKREGIVYDAGSESISISINKLKSFGVTYGKNSPLSGKNLTRYQAVRKALEDLIAQSQNGIRPAGENEQYIQGTWRVAGGNGIRSWFLEWTFDDGNFKQTGYPPITQEGKYRVSSITESKITLELYDQKGTFGTETSTVEISINREESQLTISNTKGFTRIAKANND
ncbi:MAG TPA: hypothetical protein VNB22_23535, partial [Pyrinomonadaceae bacterium]|nr:hypothetical protein [Pyrinomonadaceae bacterium]